MIRLNTKKILIFIAVLFVLLFYFESRYLPSESSDKSLQINLKATTKSDSKIRKGQKITEINPLKSNKNGDKNKFGEDEKNEKDLKVNKNGNKDKLLPQPVEEPKKEEKPTLKVVQMEPKMTKVKPVDSEPIFISAIKLEPETQQDKVKKPSSNSNNQSLNEERRKNWIQSQFKKEKKNECEKKTISRDYQRLPVIYRGYGWKGCDIPCSDMGNSAYDDIGSGTCSKSVSKTQENTGNHQGNDLLLCGNTRLSSDVPMQYFSWAEYGFMNPPREKTEKSMGVAMISNCGPTYRLEYINSLQKAGIEIDTYGSCFAKNKQGDNYGDRLNSKLDVISKYKFTLSFENSETEDYVTEKLFGPYSAGTVPIYHGAPNGKKFGPKHSMIFANDYESPEEMAKYLKYLDSNDTAYNEYLTWKKEGPDQTWISLIDLAIVHSNCRFCILSADIDRKQVGEVLTGPYINDNVDEMFLWEGKGAKQLKVRERGTFYLKWIYLEKKR
eukprot:TRINITY_DN985_c0_g1_i1.p1 TRINITY_DN985_c0_g1~~TRINITY_DN985_c0_g1_i1.p1  ORF type:complete len:497 (-),score=138.87 TRINITY_DN985_c0_g1_i1:296-1786(-)